MYCCGALQKRREQQNLQGRKGLDESARELLENNRQEREHMEDEIQELRKRNVSVLKCLSFPIIIMI